MFFAHRLLTQTDAALQTTTFTYRSTGDLETIVTPARGSLTAAQPISVTLIETAATSINVTEITARIHLYRAYREAIRQLSQRNCYFTRPADGP